ncbi:MAG: CBS domain-containing protein [bacterium]
MQAKDIMTTKVLTVSPDMGIPEVAQFLLKNDISGAPVVDDKNKLIGIITEDDLIFQDKKVHIPTMINILGAVIYLESFKHFEKEMEKIMGGKVADIMVKEVITVTEETDIQDIATLMTEKNIHLFPVMKNEAIAGIVGKADVLKAIAKGYR